MQTLLKISWLNVWRNPKRSLAMIIAVAVGLWGGVYTAALATGLLQQRFETTIGQHISHIQIHNPLFLKDDHPSHTIPAFADIANVLAEHKDVAAFSSRSRISGMLATANLTSGIGIIGIDPENEAMTTGLDENIIEGDYLTEGGRNPVLVGRKLAEKTRLQPGSRLVLTFQNPEGELISASFRVAGIYLTSNSMLDETHVYVMRQDLNEYLNMDAGAHEIAVVASNLEVVDAIAETLQSAFPSTSIRTWNEISPELSYLQEMAAIILTFVLAIILAALAFGLVNTMLMAVFERIRELGMLMAIGMNKRRVFGMIMLETSFITFLGAAGGILLGLASVGLTMRSGVNLAGVGGESLADMGFPTLIYPSVSSEQFLVLIVLVIIAALLTSIYPAMKALKLNPAEAVRKE